MERNHSRYNLFSKEYNVYPSVYKVVAGDDYILTVFFDNGEHGTLDMKQFLDFGVFRRLKNFERFKEVRVSFDTIEWPSGVDLDPEFVYSRCTIDRRVQRGDQVETLENVE